jgi:hypothetical protein
VPGYWYNDLLLDLHRLDEVGRRLAQATRTGVLLDDGLFELMRGRLVLARSAADQAVPVDAEAPLNEAVDLLRRAGRLDYLPRALLARAELRRRLRHLEDARADLEELVRLATHTTMRLYEIEGRLEYARLNLARADAAAAQRELARARDLVEATGYLRREAALADIQGQLDALLASPRSAETHAAPSELDPLGFVFRLVLDRRAPPDLLLHLDPRRLPDGLGQPAEIRRLNTELSETYAGVEPNPLWLAWVRASRERELAALRARLDHGPIRTDTR